MGGTKCLTMARNKKIVRAFNQVRSFLSSYILITEGNKVHSKKKLEDFKLKV